MTHVSKSRLRLIIVTAMGVIISALLWHGHRLSVEDLRYRMEGQEEQAGEYPLLLDHNTPSGLIHVAMTVHTGWFLPKTILVFADDCVESLSINGKEVQNSVIPYCDYIAGRPLPVGEFLKSGKNDVSVTMRNSGGEASLRIKSAAGDMRGWLVTLVFALTVTGILFALTGGKTAKLPVVLTAGAILLLVILRIQYTSVTPFGVRGHDTDSHVDYIKFIATNHALPEADAGWEYHQPPLYYALSALVYRLSLLAGANEPQALQNLQTMSVVFSILSVILLAAMAAFFFPKPIDGYKRALFLIAAGTIPSFVFPASRIGNDVLFIPLSLGLLLCLLHTYRKRSLSLWYSSCVLFSLCVLTKSTALAFAPVMLLCLLHLVRGRDLIKHIVSSALLVVVLCGWLPIVRATDEEDRTKILTMGNNGMDGGLRVETSFRNLLTFQPEGMLAHPYNHPWKDEERRQYFFEYLYRSAFFGEFHFGTSLQVLAQLMLFFGFLTLPLMILGSWKKADGADIVAIALLGCLLLAALSYRLFFPFSANQDFRFIVIAVVPITLLMIRGAERLSGTAKHFAFALIALFTLFNCIFLTAISL